MEPSARQARPMDVRLLICLAASTVLLAGCGEETASRTETTAPEGTRWVGSAGVVVAVPEWWTTGETECAAPAETTVYFDAGAHIDCEDPTPGAVTEVSSLAVLDARSGYGEYLTRDMEPIGEVAGHEVVERSGCEEWFEGVCRRVFAVPDKGVVFAVTIHDEADGNYAEIRDSVRLLPEQQTTVPLAITGGWTPSWGAEPPAAEAVVDAVRSAGLAAELVTARRDGLSDAGMVADVSKGTLLDVQPAMGSVIDAGGTVTITVAGDLPH